VVTELPHHPSLEREMESSHSNKEKAWNDNVRRRRRRGMKMWVVGEGAE
jgi:hypothetical protein